MNDRRVLFAGVGALSAAVAATSCCLPLLPFLAAAGVAGSSAFLARLQPYLLAASVVLIGYGFLQARRAKQCNRRPGIASAILLWTSTAIVGMMLLFPQLLASLIAGWNMKKSRILLLLATVLAAAGAYYVYGGSSVPEGQAALVRLNSANFPDLKHEFNAASDRVRVVVMLSPTWSTCLRGASAVQSVLSRQGDSGTRVFVVWEPVILTDWAAPSTATLRRISDRRVQQYWDRGRLLSKAMGEKDRDSIVWDYAAVYPRGAVWQDAPPKPAFEDGPVVDVAEGLAKALDLAGN
jgi:hypothetical protein